MYEIEGVQRALTTHGVQLYSNYSGTLESRLDWPATLPTFSRAFRCTLVGGQLVGDCTSEGPYPPPTIDFTHVCTSYVVGGPARGGTGNWGCYVEHDAAPPGGAWPEPVPERADPR